MRLLEALKAGLRAARVPGPVAAKVMAEAERALETYHIKDDREIYELPEWNLWLFMVKSLLSPITRLLREEGYCHANAMVVSSVMLLDERIAGLVKKWVKARCSAGLDPCCRNPPCCNIG